MVRVRVALGVVAFVLLAGTAGAQPPGPAGGRSPVYSPYLNLVRRDAPAGVNYYGLVRPQFATQSNLQSLQQQINQTQQQQQMLAGRSVVNAELPETGQVVTFLNNGGYFLNGRTGVGPANPSVTTRSSGRAAPRR